MEFANERGQITTLLTINIKNIIWKIKKIEIFTDNLKDEKLINFGDSNNEIFSIVKKIGRAHV